MVYFPLLSQKQKSNHDECAQLFSHSKASKLDV